jgi:hypothetical protein
VQLFLLIPIAMTEGNKTVLEGRRLPPLEEPSSDVGDDRVV